MKCIAFGAAAALLLSCGSALALGKVGLWKVSSTTDLVMTIPPEVQAQMKKSGMKITGMTMPAAKPYVYQMCMSQEEVNSDSPPHIDQSASGCTTQVTAHNAAAMTAEMVCSGKMKGKGTMEVAYHGAEHYTGFYNFKGSVDANPTNLKSTFKGDWVKADCGNVKPYKLRTQ